MKNRKLLIYSVISLATYYFFKYSPTFSNFFQKLESRHGVYSFGYYILIKIAGWFLLVFGFIGLIYFLFEILRKKL
jgi:hypothetical protein